MQFTRNHLRVILKPVMSHVGNACSVF